MGTVRDSVTGASTARSPRTTGAEKVVPAPAPEVVVPGAAIAYDAARNNTTNTGNAPRGRTIA